MDTRFPGQMLPPDSPFACTPRREVRITVSDTDRATGAPHDAKSSYKANHQDNDTEVPWTASESDQGTQVHEVSRQAFDTFCRSLNEHQP